MRRPLRDLGRRRRGEGQALVEYVVVGTVLVGALFVVDLPGGRTGAQYLVDMVRAFYQGLTYFLSLP